MQMGSSTADNLLQLGFLVIIITTVIILLCILICKIRSFIRPRPMLILNDIYSKHAAEKVDLPKSERNLAQYQIGFPQKSIKEQQPTCAEKSLEKTFDKSDIIKDVFSLDTEQMKTKKRKYHNATVF